jgi:APA family basic amino acid/polyamine antiporter
LTLQITPPYIPENTGVIWRIWMVRIAAGAGTVFFAFIGFDCFYSCTRSKTHKKGMPIGILGSLVICTILYVLFAHVMTGLVPYNEFAGDAKPATAFARTGYTFYKLV